mmetsp:Transcript_9779/g.16209  ORF Transcript_9779/g.16209 Transcript_9779/m.16209 type:complete len:438 (-) Transcript_9779:813-2126(-)
MKGKELLEEERVSHTQHLNVTSPKPSDNTPARNILASTGGGGTSFSPHFIRLGILGAEKTNKKTVSAIRNPISLCTVTAIASNDRAAVERFINDWVSHPFGGSGSDIAVFPGEATFGDLIESDLIDAIYIPFPDTFQKDLILKALECNKHVIIDLPCGPCSLGDMNEIIDAAKRNGKLFMDGSKFAHHQRTTEFISRIACPDFGPVEQIEVEFSVMKDDARSGSSDELVWLSEHNNVLTSLGWYCARIAVAILEETRGEEDTEAGELMSATVKSISRDEAGNLNEIKADVTFANCCVLSFQCCLGVRSTRQSIKVFADEYSGELYDTFHPHDIFTSFQIHKKEFSNDPMIQGPIEIVDSIECRAGPLQDAYIWRKFGALARGIDDACLAHKLPLRNMNMVEWPEGPAAREANLMLDSALETQAIIDALLRCVEEKGE